MHCIILFLCLTTANGKGDHEIGGVCETASDQSPINIDTFDLEDSDCDSELGWKVKADHKEFYVENNCAYLEVIPWNEGDFANTARNNIAKLSTEDLPNDLQKYDEYCLAQFHFHWGAKNKEGSEHQIDGKTYPLEVHFVHFACEYGTFSEAREEGERTGGKGSADHTLAVVAFLFEIDDDDNPAFDQLLSDDVMNDIKRDCVSHSKIKKHAILSDLLPKDWKRSGYYAYQGGLTTSPCTDDVNWIILKKKGKISSKQMTKLRQLRDDDDNKIKQNWREIVDNPNPVFGCFDDTYSPTIYPTELPTVQPSDNPTENPTNMPSYYPTEIPTENPTENPTIMPSEMPSVNPTFDPTIDPTYDPTQFPTDKPKEDGNKRRNSVLRRIDSSSSSDYKSKSSIYRNRVWWSHNHRNRRNKHKFKYF